MGCRVLMVLCTRRVIVRRCLRPIGWGCFGEIREEKLLDRVRYLLCCYAMMGFCGPRCSDGGSCGGVYGLLARLFQANQPPPPPGVLAIDEAEKEVAETYRGLVALVGDHLPANWPR